MKKINLIWIIALLLITGCIGKATDTSTTDELKTTTNRLCSTGDVNADMCTKISQAIIQTVSEGNPNKISLDGKAGLGQFDYIEAKEMPQFKRVEICCKLESEENMPDYCAKENEICKGEWCEEGDYRCSPLNDDRFLVDLSLYGVTTKVKNYQQRYNDNALLIAIAYKNQELADNVKSKLENKEPNLVNILSLLEVSCIRCSEKEIGKLESYLQEFALNFKRFKGEIEITNIKDTLPEEFIGTYAVNPSFTVEINYDINDYYKIRNKLEGDQGLIRNVEKCQEDNDIEDCIDKEIIKINKELQEFIFFKGPCDTEENIKSDFVEHYLACQELKEDDCICQIILDRNEKQEKQQVNIELKKTLPDTFTEDDIFTIDEYIEELQPFQVTKLDLALPRYEEVNILLFKFFEQETSKTLDFYKKDKKLYFIADKNKAEKPICKPDRREFKFCVQKNKEVMALVNNQVEFKPLQYKFALTFGDNKPPEPVENIEVFDNLIAESSVIVKWDKNTARDLGQYHIIAAKENLDKETQVIKLENGYFIVDINSIEIDENVVDTDFGKCDFDYNKSLCIYDLLDGNKLELKRGILYHFKTKTEDYYAYVVDYINDSSDYSFTVTAVDIFGNEIDNINKKLNWARGKSIDDLPPDKVGILSLKKQEDTEDIYKVLFTKPLINIDRTDAVDIKGFNFYCSNGLIKNIEFEKNCPTTNIDISLCSEIDCEATATLKGNFLAITAIDEKGNEFKEVNSIPIE